MRYCPNEACPYLKKYKRAAEFQDIAEICSDCGTALPAPSIGGAVAVPLPAPATRSIADRLAVTAAVVIGAAAATMVPLPGMALQVRAAGVSSPGLFELGLSPLFAGFGLVELVALAIPGWRPLRHGNPSGRALLWRWSLGVGAAIAVMQAWNSVQFYAQSHLLAGSSVMSDDVVIPPWGIGALLVLGTAAYTAAALFASRRGLGAGLSTVMFGIYLGNLLQEGRSLVELMAQDVLPPATGLLFVAGLGAFGWAVAWLLRRHQRVASDVRPAWLPMPVCGLTPLGLTGAVLSIASVLASWIPGADGPLRALQSNRVIYAGASALIGLNMAIVFGILFNRPSAVAAAWATSDVEQARALQRTRAVLPRAIAESALLIVAFSLLPFALTTFTVLVQHMPLSSIIWVVALALDLASEARARTASDLTTAWTLERPYEVEPALARLQEAGIAATARGQYGRVILQFFGPYLPIELLVAPEDADRARSVMAGAAP